MTALIGARLAIVELTGRVCSPRANVKAASSRYVFTKGRLEA